MHSLLMRPDDECSAAKAGRQAAHGLAGAWRTVVVLLSCVVRGVVSLKRVADQVHQALAVVQHDVCVETVSL
jgi:hypothetical protein